MICMGVRVEHPFNAQALILRDVQKLIHAFGRKAIGLGIEVPDHINQRGLFGCWVRANVLD
ncbi:hypothetical protein DSM107133_02582 [Pseudosulfitobacter sp. DSM 107133]|nr:hypothetical protein DSM107133_02582 [Pseudosulfitobacter sp. DSM 107133]